MLISLHRIEFCEEFTCAWISDECVNPTWKQWDNLSVFLSTSFDLIHAVVNTRRKNRTKMAYARSHPRGDETKGLLTALRSSFSGHCVDKCFRIRLDNITSGITVKHVECAWNIHVRELAKWLSARPGREMKRMLWNLSHSQRLQKMTWSVCWN